MELHAIQCNAVLNDISCVKGQARRQIIANQFLFSFPFHGVVLCCLHVRMVVLSLAFNGLLTFDLLFKLRRLVTFLVDGLTSGKQLISVRVWNRASESDWNKKTTTETDNTLYHTAHEWR